MYKIYGKNWCVFCDRAKKLLKEKELPFEYYNIEEDSEAFNYASSNSNGQKTVPYIFRDEVFIGGFDELWKSLKGIQ